MEEILRKYIEEKYQGETSGHNTQHIFKVVENTRFLGQAEKLSSEELEKALIVAYLHEELDHKLVDSQEIALENLKIQLVKWHFKEPGEIIRGIEAVSFSKRTAENKVPFYIKVVQDADLLEAIGAMGIIRTITFGAVKNRVLYDPLTKGIPNSSTIQHFDDKLLKIPDYLSTATGQKQGQKRMKIMTEFLDAFYEEWEGLQ